MIFLSLSAIICHAESWYIKRATNNSQPPLDSSMKYISRYDAFYLDTEISDSDKVIYLTFDAGYENGNIERILDVMKKHNVKSAFFVLKNLVSRNTDLVKRMADEGHLVCNHTANHHDMSKVTSFEEFKCELTELETLYKETTGRELAKYYRPPEGKFTESNLKYAKEVYVPNTANTSSIIMVILGIVLTGAGLNFVYKNRKKA